MKKHILNTIERDIIRRTTFDSLFVFSHTFKHTLHVRVHIDTHVRRARCVVRDDTLMRENIASLAHDVVAFTYALLDIDVAHVRVDAFEYRRDVNCNVAIARVINTIF